MARKFVNKNTMCVLGLLIVAAVLWVMFGKSVSPFQTFPMDCKGITCDEGQFCQNNKCQNVYVPATSEPEGY